MDGKQQISEASSKLDEVVTENSELKSQLEAHKASRVLNELSAKLPDYKRKYVAKVLGNKNAQFIVENFNYTLELFDKETQKQNEVLKQEAQTQVVASTVEPEVIAEEVVEESTATDNDDPLLQNYMGERGKY